MDMSGDFDRAEPMLVSVAEAARRLSISRSSAYELVAAGELEVVHIGRSARVPVAALASYVERLRRSVA